MHIHKSNTNTHTPNTHGYITHTNTSQYMYTNTQSTHIHTIYMCAYHMGITSEPCMQTHHHGSLNRFLLAEPRQSSKQFNFLECGPLGWEANLVVDSLTSTSACRPGTRRNWRQGPGTPCCSSPGCLFFSCRLCTATPSPLPCWGLSLLRLILGGCENEGVLVYLWVQVYVYVEGRDQSQTSFLSTICLGFGSFLAWNCQAGEAGWPASLEIHLFPVPQPWVHKRDPPHNSCTL